jgi:prepilin-type N-terminal cleavage/methylation domain-containing protein
MTRHAATRRPFHSRGFSLLELMVCSAILLIATLAAAGILVGAQQGWQKVNDDALAGLVDEGRAARIVFQKAVRRASLRHLEIGAQGDWIELPYYETPESDRLDRYATLSWSQGRLRLEEGRMDMLGTREALRDSIVCTNVSGCVFRRDGTAVQMNLTIHDAATTVTLAAAAVLNNR